MATMSVKDFDASMPKVEAIETVTDVEEAELRKLRKKVDFRLVPILALLYLISFVDRSNIKSISAYLPVLH